MALHHFFGRLDEWADWDAFEAQEAAEAEEQARRAKAKAEWERVEEVQRAQLALQALYLQQEEFFRQRYGAGMAQASLPYGLERQLGAYQSPPPGLFSRANSYGL